MRTLGAAESVVMKLFSRIRDWYRRSSVALTVPPGQSFPAVGVMRLSEFRYGVEILNDSQTPMTFVLQVLQEYAGLSQGDAAVAVAACHSQGGVLIPMETMDSAEQVAGRVLRAAQLKSLPLTCRAVGDAQNRLTSAASESNGDSGAT